MRALLAAALVLLALPCAQDARAQAPQKPAAQPPQETKREPAFVAPESARVSLDRALAAGVAWMLANQNADGSFGSHHSPRPIEVLASVPGSQGAFRIATTALGVLGLRATAPSDAAVDAAVGRALELLLASYAVKRQSGLEHYNVWAFGYVLQCFGEELLRAPGSARAPALRAACAELVEKLAAYQTLDGGWGYLSLGPVPTFQPSETSMSFTTATILLGLERARRAGIAVPATLLARAVDEIQNSRLPDGAFLYGDYLRYRPRHGINQPAGSACRASVCLLALERLGEPVSAAEHERALVDLLVRFPDYQKAGVRRPIPHESWYAISGYFYLYGHAYAAWTLEKLPREKQRRLAERLVEAVLYCRDPDGSFWDYPLYSYHKAYGTGFALIALANARAALAR